MIKCKIITGYVPIVGHPRNAQTYGDLGEKLAEIRACPVKAYYNQISQCWMHPFVDRLKFKPTHSQGDNPEKNSLHYHMVQHQKTEWLFHASLEDKEPDVFVWIDYGVFHLPGVTKDVIEDFISRLAKDDLAIPGCWERRKVSDDSPCWRFCGSVLVCPRPLTQSLDWFVKKEAKRRLLLTKNISWEVNTWARVEKFSPLPIRWYSADHNETLFTNYRAPAAV
jgi:hypothetical protein